MMSTIEDERKILWRVDGRNRKDVMREAKDGSEVMNTGGSGGGGTA